ncbi:hypothetical protein [Phenylobacterium sp.]|uniref:hypothetical protein n=1 Tax=Phenylobacterium sp. TaxID=1871053 RepID=UPI0025F8EAD7|nr:hypothetical protein [Phenylobacterium sp.]
MELAELSDRAWTLRQRYAELETRRHGRPWSREEVALGFVGDVGDLMKLVQAAEGVRPSATPAPGFSTNSPTACGASSSWRASTRSTWRGPSIAPWPSSTQRSPRGFETPGHEPG